MPKIKTVYEFNKTKTNALIKLWEQKPDLHNLQGNNYTQKATCDKFSDIANKLNAQPGKAKFTAEDVKKRMQSLLAHHNKELQKIQKSKASGSKKIYKPEWCYFHKLHFLRKEIQVNKKKIEKNEERPSTSTNNNGNHELNIQPIASTSGGDTSTTLMPTPLLINSKREHDTNLDANAPKSKKVKTADDCEFGRLVSEELKKINDPRTYNAISNPPKQEQ
ncbi:Alcohol dehydrogenase transcription factor Myb/SANT-like [Popillia japonica]|uniref:Alcohol dehydrogenase transcription factor Myb/SANT-like n=1 Tax=Popillia japonica TaxID=7064 RepID=A0AAW1L4Y2_POPJA